MSDRDDGPIEGELLGSGANPLESLLGGGSMPDIGSLMEGLSSMQEIQASTYEGSAGGGLVRITASGRMEVQSVVIDPAALEENDADLVADLVLAALNDLTAKITDAQQQAMGGFGGLLGQ